MRLVLSVGVVCAVLVGAGLVPGLTPVQFGPAEARAETSPGRAQCKKLALEKKALDKSGVRQYLAMSPEKVAAERGKPVVERVRYYIALSEKVLFQCPRYVLNANITVHAQDSSVVPPLPVKGPKRRVRVRRLKQPLVPLPVKRQSRRAHSATLPG